jgi:hypothetical protein
VDSLREELNDRSLALFEWYRAVPGCVTLGPKKLAIDALASGFGDSSAFV